jgi:hypothetical protein
MKISWLIIAAVLVLALGGTALAATDSDIGSRIARIAEAIAYAEGFYVNGSRPQRNNNPGDLTKALGFSMIGYDGMYVIFSTIDDGWNALRKLVMLMLTNRSAIYHSQMTILDVARRYTTTQQDEWAQNVASRLGVTIDTKISEV